MRRIAHLSDVHMLDRETRRSSARYRLATRAVSLGRAIDPKGRAKKLARALDAAKASGADHFVLSGDLTELGEQSEFEHLASVLHDARMPSHALTIVPGNHDAYASPTSWQKALEGPLAPWAEASATEPGKVVDRGEVVFLPIDSSCYQSIAFSRGVFTREAAKAVAARLGDPALRNKSVVIVLHHPPEEQSNPVWAWIDALRGGKQLVDMLMGHPRAQLLHGHLHQVVDRIVGLGKTAAARARIFGAPAICDDKDKARVRLYDLRDGLLENAGIFAQ